MALPSPPFVFIGLIVLFARAEIARRWAVRNPSFRPIAKNLCRKKSFPDLGILSLRSDLESRPAKIARGCLVPGAPVRSVTQSAALCRHLRSALRAAFQAGYVASFILRHALPRKILTRSFRQIFLAKSLNDYSQESEGITFPTSGGRKGGIFRASL